MEEFEKYESKVWRDPDSRGPLHDYRAELVGLDPEEFLGRGRTPEQALDNLKKCFHFVRSEADFYEIFRGRAAANLGNDDLYFRLPDALEAVEFWGSKGYKVGWEGHCLHPNGDMGPVFIGQEWCVLGTVDCFDAEDCRKTMEDEYERFVQESVCDTELVYWLWW